MILFTWSDGTVPVGDRKRESGAGIPSTGIRDGARETILDLLAGRAADSTVCPSEVARAIATAAGRKDWRGGMPAVHAEIDAMVEEGLVRLSWKGDPMPIRFGPYRIGRAAPGA